MTSRDERNTRTDFAQQYSLPNLDANTRIVQAVIGAVWGANGYTTVAQADELGRRLQLQPGQRLLDVGTGRGWPGLYLAKRHGCSVVGTDMPSKDLSRRRGGANRKASTNRCGWWPPPGRPSRSVRRHLTPSC